MKTDRQICESYARQLSNGFYDVDLDGFAAACFNDNTIAELRASLQSRSADKTDCETWKITATHWRGAIECALAAKLIADNGDQLPA